MQAPQKHKYDKVDHKKSDFEPLAESQVQIPFNDQRIKKPSEMEPVLKRPNYGE